MLKLVSNENGSINLNHCIDWEKTNDWYEVHCHISHEYYKKEFDELKDAVSYFEEKEKEIR